MSTRQIVTIPGLPASGGMDGKLLIGSGSGFALTTLTAGAGVIITPGAGSITLSVTGGGGGSGITVGSTIVTGGTVGDLLTVGPSGEVEQLSLGSGLSTSGGAIIVTGAPPTGAAGGDLAGTYPSPTLSDVKRTNLVMMGRFL